MAAVRLGKKDGGNDDTMTMGTETMAELQEKAWNKRATILWGSELTQTDGLKEWLSRLTRDELAAIRRSLQLKGVSSLKKTELVELLTKELPAALTALLGMLDSAQLEIIKGLAEAGGLMSGQTFDDERVAFFRKRGLFFSGLKEGKRHIVMPREMVTAFAALDQAQLRKTAAVNNEAILLVQGLLYYYGALTLSQIREIAQALGALNELADAELATLLRENAAVYYDLLACDGDLYFHLLADPEKVRAEHALRPALKWRSFTLRELCLAGQQGFVEKTESFLRLTEFIMEYYAITRGEAEGLVEECVVAINDGYSLTELIELLQESLEMDSDGMVQDFVALLTYLTNNTRQWGLKGHTPAELSIQDLAYKNVLQLPVKKEAMLPAGRSVGRNEPCPCGSGKKYKKCCGNA